MVVTTLFCDVCHNHYICEKIELKVWNLEEFGI